MGSVKFSTCICANPGKELKVSTQLDSTRLDSSLFFLCYFPQRFFSSFFLSSSLSVTKALRIFKLRFLFSLFFFCKYIPEHVKGGDLS